MTTTRARLLPRSIRGRLTLLFAVGTAAAVGVTSLAIYVVLSRRVDAAVNTTLDSKADTIIGNLGDGPPEVGADEPYAIVLDDHGNVLASSRAVIDPAHTLQPDELARARDQTILIDRSIPGLSNDARLLAKPHTQNGQTLIVVTGIDLDPSRDSATQLITILLVSTPLLAAVIAVGAWLAVGAALRPVHRLTTQAETISRADRDARLPTLDTGDEIAELAETLNNMLARLADSFRRERAFVDDASHELRTPLAVLQGELELALGGPADPDVQRAALRSSLDETRRLTQLAEDLLVLSRAESGQLPLQREPVDLADLTRNIAHRPSNSNRHITIRGAAVVDSDPDRLAQIITNLLTNAEHWARNRVDINITQQDGHASITVADDGPGFPAAFLPDAFNRFSQANPARSRAENTGSGLGLAIVDAITRLLHGKVHIDTSPLGGAAVTVVLPAGVGLSEP